MQPPCQPSELMTRLPALLADPAQDELPTDEAMPNLFWRVSFGVEEDRPRLVMAAAGVICAGNLDTVPYPAFNRQRRNIHPRTEIDGDLEIPSSTVLRHEHGDRARP
jgi:hypothetical protein